jgi:phosphoglycolate phosphatase
MNNNKNTNYKNIIWDWNGTLLDDVQLCNDIINIQLVKRSLPAISLKTYREIFTFPVKDYYIKAGFDFKDESFEKIGKDFIDEYEIRKTNCSLFPNTMEILSRIKLMNIKQYLLSAYKHDTLEKLIEHFNLSQYFESINGLNHIYADGKLELGKRLMQEIREHDKEGKTLLIGDTVHDYEVASEIGADCVLISTGHQDESKLRVLDIPVLSNIKEVLKLL